MQAGSLDEIAWDNGWIDNEALEERARLFAKSTYGEYLRLLMS